MVRRLASASAMQPGCSTHGRCPAAGIVRTWADGIRAAASSPGVTGIGLCSPRTKIAGTVIPLSDSANPAASCSNMEPRVCALAATETRMVAGHGGAVAGSAKYPGHSTAVCSVAVSSVGPSAGIRPAISCSRSIPPGASRSMSAWPISARPPSPVTPGPSMRSRPATRAGWATASCSARCAPHEWPTTTGRCTPRASSTAMASPTLRSTVKGPATVDGARPRCW
jgi:hypothetical protein